MSSREGDETIRQYGSGRNTRDPLIGATVDSYQVESVVGTGAMGIVYRGVHTVIGKAVAIKVLKPNYADDPEMVQRLVREARTVNAIRHPGIVDIFGFGTLPRSGQPYIVMDLLEGEPLDAFVAREAPVPVRTAGAILDELLSALHAAHQVGVVHRDLKPGNVFLEALPEGGFKLKVIDFGLARQAEKAGGSIAPTNPGTLLGTPAFMAPEQVLGQKLTPATDLYAVGGIAYQLLTGHLPHEAPSAIEVLSQKMSHDPIRPKQWNPKLSDELDAWVRALLVRDLPDRLGDADEARRQLRRLLDARTVSGPQGPIPRGSQGGVVLQRGAATADTDEHAANVSTADHHSPFAPAPQLTPPNPTHPHGFAEAPAHLKQTSPLPMPMPPNPTHPHGFAEVPARLKQTSPLPMPHAVPDVTLRRPGPGDETMAPGAPPALTPPAPTLLLRPNDETQPPRALRPPDADAHDEALLVRPSRLPLVLALLGTITALLGGLWWLFSLK